MKSILVLALVLYLICCANCQKKPNILFILADDLGYNDVSWHNTDMISPNLEKLARNGIILEQHYVQPICSPTRSALMTGYYPVHTGRQNSVIWAQEPKGLFTNFTLMPEYLKKLGYSTHAIGKWHLGFCHNDYLPTSRGFDTFHGFLAGRQNYYSHLRETSVGGGPPGYDYRVNTRIDLSANGTYSSYLIAKHAMDIIQDHGNRSKSQNSGKPLFMYLPFQNVHEPLQAPKKYVNMYKHVQNKARRTYSGMLTALDDAVGKIVNSLKQNGLFDDTLIVFSSDNGGQTLRGGNNYPLRGNKGTLWEGGTRVSAFVYGPKYLAWKGVLSDRLMHVVDWVPTFISAAGGNPEKMLKGSIDGIDHWSSLTNGTHSPRSELLYNIDPHIKNAAFRSGDMKIILGDPGKPDGWIPPPKVLNVPAQEIQDLFKPNSDGNSQGYDFAAYCNKLQVRLFNLTADPFEENNIAAENPEIVMKLTRRLQDYHRTMIPPDITAEIKEGNPNLHGGFYGPGWCQSEPRKSTSEDRFEKHINDISIKVY